VGFQGGDIQSHAAIDAVIFGPAKKFAGSVAGENDVWSGMPPLQPAGAKPIVFKKKVMHRMLLAALPSCPMWLRPLCDAFLVRALPGQPFGLG
jgi:hypothetical protein